MSKFELVTAMMFPALGAYLGHRKFGQLIVSFALMAVVFAFAQDLVHYGRTAIAEKSGNIDHAGFGERIEIVRRYFSEEDRTEDWQIVEERQGWWTRLNFSGSQVFAMSLYDSGNIGSTLKDIWIRFVPRVLWPEKPIIRPLGADLYNLSVNREGTSNLGLSIYGDLYWQFGWAGVCMGSPVIGWLFAMMSWRSLRAIGDREFIMLPAVLVAMLTAAQGTNNFVLDGVISKMPVYFAYLFAVGLLVKYVHMTRRPALG
jgi:hypothetical protein